MQETLQLEDDTRGVATPANVVQRIHQLLVKSHVPLADEFLTLKHVQAAADKPPALQRHLVNHQLRLVLGEMGKNTSLARAALDDTSAWSEYLKALKEHTIPALRPAPR